MQFHPKLRFATAALLLAAAVGCGGKVPPTNFYVLNLAAPAPAGAALEHSAVLMPVRVGNLIRQGRIVYRETPETVGFYEYHRWAEDPEESVSRSLLRHLRALGTFASVVPFDGRTAADYLLRSELVRLEEVDYDGPPNATVEIALELVEFENQTVVWSGSAIASELVETSEVRSVVSRMGVAASRAIEELSGKLDRHLRGQS